MITAAIPRLSSYLSCGFYLFLHYVGGVLVIVLVPYSATIQ